MLNMLITGTITEPSPTPDAPPVKVVYQRVSKGLGNIPTAHPYDLQRRAHVIPADPQTPAQMAKRAAFAAAVASWHNATTEERETVRSIADKRRISLFNAWISTHL